MRAAGLLVHLYPRGKGWALYRIQGRAPLPKELRATPEAPGHLDAEGGLLLHVTAGDIFPVKVRVAKPRALKRKRTAKLKP